MKDIKCPLCGNPLKLSTIENKGQLHFYACYECNYQLRMSPHKDFALEYAKIFISKFPPIMRLNKGENVMLFADKGIYTIIDIDLPKGRIYLKDEDEYKSYYYADEIEIWPWELEEKGREKQ